MAGSPRSDSDDRWVCDVLIVGAGPAGTAAAIEATRRGLDTVVIDKARFPRDKCCGDGLTASALRLLDDFGLDRSLLPSWIEVSEATLYGPTTKPIALPLPSGNGSFAAVCRRRELDSALVDLARRRGATVLEDHELTGVSQTGGEVIARVDGIEFSARYLIAADGMWSPTRKLLGVFPVQYRGEWHAFRQYFVDVSTQAANELVVWFEPDLLPGYAWSFPLGDGTANVGFGIQRGRGHKIQDMARLWPQLLERAHIAEFLGPEAKPETPHRAWPIPARLGRAPLTTGRVFFVGDAAAATDPLTGEGIGQALETGRVAIKAIAEAELDDPAAAAIQYRQSLRRGMMRDHLLARSLSTMMSKRSLARGALATCGATAWTRRHFARWLFEDYPRAAVFTPGRWSRELLRRPGAFASPSGSADRGPTPALSPPQRDVGE
ncbi:MAG: geranylgeranyl reductase family protein [Actinomycetia bacterium]|nr:geranylgeranyl reductase family protein [Actinomycetes bacterium]